MRQQKISIDGSNVEFAYSDSGPVPGTSSYTTLVLVHGLCFSSPIFQKLQSAAPSKGVRAIAFNRRHYPGSTRFTEQEIKILKDGSKAQKDEWIKSHGHHLALFLDALIQKHHLCPISPDGLEGGLVIVGWSLGAGDALCSIAHADTLPPSVRSRLTSFIRSLILYEPPPFAVGYVPTRKFWAPFSDENIPTECRFPMFSSWITAYFDHGDLSTRDFNALEWVVPSTSRPGSIYRMSKAEQDEIIKYDGSLADVPYMEELTVQLNTAYRKVLMDPETRKTFQNMSITCLAGENGPGATIAQVWDVQNELQKNGSQLGVKLASGTNHFVHWDDPARAIDLFLECAEMK